MNLRFAGMITGCMLVGASAAAYHRADSRPAPTGATLAAATPELPTPPSSVAWPPARSVAFYEEMFEQLPVATAPAAAQAETPPARGANAGAGGQQTPVPVRIVYDGGPQTRPAQRINARPGSIQTPQAGNAAAAAGGQQTLPADGPKAAPDAGPMPPERAANAGNGGQPPQRPGVSRPREAADMIEVVIHDRLGRPIGVRRVDRRLLAGAPAYPSPHRPHRLYHSHAHGPQGGQGRRGGRAYHGPHGLYR